MRYIIETKEDEMAIGKQIALWEKDDKLQIIEKGDKFEMVKIELVKIKQALQTLNKLGINKDVMETYIYQKSKVRISDMKSVLHYQDEFMKKLGIL